MKKLIIALCLSLALFGCQSSANADSKNVKRKVAPQAYSFHKTYTVEEMVEKLKGCDIDGVECFPGQAVSKSMPGVKMNPKMNRQQRDFVKKLFRDANIKIVSFGVTNTKNEAEVKELCEFAKDMGFDKIMTEDPVARFPIWEKYGKQYGVTMCVHHHTNSSSNQYWDPETLKKFVSGYEHVKSCPDVGHWSRCGIDPVKGLKTLEGTIGSVHFKDQKKFGAEKNDPAVFGEGELDVKGMLAELDRQGFDGYFVIEYEADWDNNLPLIKKCVEFLRKN